MTRKTAHFSRMDSNETKTVKCIDWNAAQEVANMLGREGWVLKDITDTPHEATVKYYGPTYYEQNNGLAAKRAWIMQCSCGDSDGTQYKRDAVAIAKAHTPNVTAFPKSATYENEWNAGF